MKKLSILLIALTLTSCGARKVQKSQTIEKETTTIVDTTKTVTQVDNLTNVQVVENCDEVTFKPIDNTIPMVLNGKSYLNVVLMHKKTNTTTNTKKVKKSIKMVKNGITVNNNKVKTVTTKDVQREAFNLWSLWWLWLLLILIVLIYKYRYRLLSLFA